MAKRQKSTFVRLSKLNRCQRRKFQRQLLSDDPGLTIVHPNAAGIEVGNASHYAAVPPDRDPEHVREFGCWTADLCRLADWLQSCRIDTVALQATGVYWFALYFILIGRGLQVTVVNAVHTKNVPGRKSDVQECQWLMKLHTYGLLRDSFHTPEHMEKVRTLWRVRDSRVKQASREEVARSLEGHWREDVLFELRQAVDRYQFAHLQMQECDQVLQRYLAELPTQPLAMPRPAAEPERPGQTKPGARAKRTRKPKGNAPQFDLQTELTRIAGVDLTSVDGIDVMTAQTIIAEIGTDLSAFQTEDHFASWLGLCPSKDVSGGKVIGTARKKVRNRVAMALRTAAMTLKESKTYLGAKYRHLQTRLPSKTAATKAMARYLAVLVYRLLTRGQAWVDQGMAQFEQKREQRELALLLSKAQAKGFRLVPLTVS